jgi:acyl carrier protein
MTKREDYAARLKELVNQLAEEGTHVDVDSDLVDDVGLSSIEIMELVEQLEDTYDISFPLIVKPLVLDLDRGTVTGKWQIPNTPDPASCRFEITGLDGPFPKHALFPPESVSAAKGEQWITLGEPKAEQVLALHAETTMKRVHQVTITALSQQGEDPDPSWLKDKSRRMVKSQRNQRFKELQAELAGLSAAVQRFDAADATKLTEADKQTGNAAKARLERETTLATQMQKLEELCKALNDVGKIHFRVIYEVEGHAIELLRTEAPAAN